jgi:uncharacterized membrane protein
LLPKAAGDEIRKNMREADEENHAALKKNIEKDRAEMRTLLTAPAFDRKAFLTKAKDLRDLQTQGKENQDDAFAAAAVQLSSEERAAFAHALDGAAVAKPAHHADAAPTSESKERFQSAKESELSPAAGNN